MYLPLRRYIVRELVTIDFHCPTMDVNGYQFPAFFNIIYFVLNRQKKLKTQTGL